ncbi:hypothetical protein B0J15DRAFT_497550 [Fusarium solani]|uniref:Uncharacterized protein n=1 Tax=Fusarium solani TaxID=169388 RepID=A0A9P9H1F9_FUSSL|nr:uncharacterized protein B0J15DRAFT_497550 [Fusarium solani]KAH7249393.1 hypothetical protein B0J15DRAFT_497550 [Fusarium solani]
MYCLLFLFLSTHSITFLLGQFILTFTRDIINSHHLNSTTHLSRPCIHPDLRLNHPLPIHRPLIGIRKPTPPCGSSVTVAYGKNSGPGNVCPCCNSRPSYPITRTASTRLAAIG